MSAVSTDSVSSVWTVGIDSAAEWCPLSWTEGGPEGGTTIGASRPDPMAYASMIDIVRQGMRLRYGGSAVR